MGVINNAVLMRRELLTRITKLYSEGELELKIDRIPIELRPRDFENTSRCCIYKDRAMIRYKLMALLGFNIQDETDETVTLKEYAERAFQRTGISAEPLTVVDDVCSGCVRVNYVVTNMCRGCMARSCMVNCPKDAIEFNNGQAHIDHQKCVNCGLCMKNCPYHAIIYIPVPCEESCPVGAISKGENGIEHIDYSKCIYCGRCVASCPFGAVMEKSHLIDVFKAQRENKKVIAMVAPAIAGQFKAPLAQILGAIKQLGFHDVIEVAKGADVTTDKEAHEFLHKMEEGQPFMTTSCCPSYKAVVRKHIPEIKEYMSDTGSPLHYTAAIAREKYPDGVLVFIGPCLAKRQEAYTDENTDYMLSFEEIGAMFVAKGIDVGNSDELTLDNDIDKTSRGYAVSQGVMRAIQTKLGDKATIRPVVINGINKDSIKEMRSFAKSCPGNMVEVMACEGGCVGGCNVIANTKVATRQINEMVK